MSEIKKYLTTKEAAAYLSLSFTTLIAYRANKTGPAYKKIGRLVRYDIQEIDLWLENNSEKMEA